MEEKNFLDVFTELKNDKFISSSFNDVLVKRIVNNKSKNLIRVYIKSSRLIHKNDIYKAEIAISRLLGGIRVKIIESFNLSSQYNSENLFNMYKDSIFIELNNHSPLEYSMLKKARISFNDDIMMVKMDDSIISEEKSKELKRILEKIFNERCGVITEVRFDFVENNKRKFKEYNEIKLKQEVEAIVSNITYDIKDIGTNEETKSSVNSASQTSKSDNSRNDNFVKQGARKSYSKPFKSSDNPDVIYGRYFDGQSIDISEIQGDMGDVIVRGQIIDIEQREIRGEKTIVSTVITDFTDSIVVKFFMQNDKLDELFANVKVGAFIKVSGPARYDKFDNDISISSVYGAIKINDFTVKRVDTSPEKRVELHCHTKLSDMDGVADVKDLIKRAKDWGHTSLAITDHGVVQGFTEAWHALQKLEGKFSFKEPFDFKMIYGVEAYLVDDLKKVVTNSAGQSLDSSYVIFDLETTGFSPELNNIIEIGAVKVKDGKIIDRFSAFVNPKEPIPFRIEQLTGINDGMVINAPGIETVLPEFLDFSKDCVMVAHNADFDTSFIIKRPICLV